MPSTKRQRTSVSSSASSRGDSERSGSDSPRPHKSARKATYEDKENEDPIVRKEQVSSPVDYVGMTPHRGCSGGFSVCIVCTSYFVERKLMIVAW